VLAIGCDLPPAPARPSRSLPLVSLFPAHAIALSRPSPSLRVMTRADSLAPLLQASDKAKKTPGQAKSSAVHCREHMQIIHHSALVV
jgi:hypothetical protein